MFRFSTMKVIYALLIFLILSLVNGQSCGSAGLEIRYQPNSCQVRGCLSGQSGASTQYFQTSTASATTILDRNCKNYNQAHRACNSGAVYFAATRCPACGDTTCNANTVNNISFVETTQYGLTCIMRICRNQTALCPGPTYGNEQYTVSPIIPTVAWSPLLYSLPRLGFTGNSVYNEWDRQNYTCPTTETALNSATCRTYNAANNFWTYLWRGEISYSFDQSNQCVVSTCNGGDQMSSVSTATVSTSGFSFFQNLCSNSLHLRPCYHTPARWTWIGTNSISCLSTNLCSNLRCTCGSGGSLSTNVTYEATSYMGTHTCKNNINNRTRSVFSSTIERHRDRDNHQNVMIGMDQKYIYVSAQSTNNNT